MEVFFWRITDGILMLENSRFFSEETLSSENSRMRDWGIIQSNRLVKKISNSKCNLEPLSNAAPINMSI